MTRSGTLREEADAVGTGQPGDEKLDEELVQVVQWVETWGDRLVGFAMTYVRDAEVAQDVAQETFLRLVALRRRTPGRAVHPGWLFTVARRLCLDYLRRRVPAQDTGREAPDPCASGAFLTVEVESVLRQLSRGDRECLWLFYYGGLSLSEMAAQLGVPPDRVKARLFRARRRFGQRWRDDDPGRP